MIDPISRVYRRVIHLFRPAKTTAPTVETGVLQSVQVQHNPFEVRSVASAQLFGLASAMPTGSDVLIANVAGDNSNGMIVASNHAPSRPTGLAEGEVKIYDQRGQSIYLKADGSIVITSTNSATIVAPTLTVVGNMVVTGNISDLNGAHGTMGTLRSDYDIHTHTLTDSRGDSATTSTPTPQDT